MLKLTSRRNGCAQDPQTLPDIHRVSPTLAQLLIARGVTHPDQLDLSLGKLLPADTLQGVNDAVDMLDAAIDQHDQILIVGDFDCDGATSTALMMRVLSQMGGSVDFIVPDRFKYGYGLTPEIVELGVKKFAPDLIVTVDNGISSHAGVAKAHELGIKVIITDHHLTTKSIPAAAAVVNPNQASCQFNSKSLVGVGVAFYVLGRLAKHRRVMGKSSVQVSQYLDLVALGTIADVGILDHNNRILVHHGVQLIRSKQCCVGILALLEQASKGADKLTAQDLGFVLGPRINAAGRMDSMDVGIKCLLTDDQGEAQRLAYELDKLNIQRRRVETAIREQADCIVDDINTANDERDQCSIVLYDDSWHQGVVGIVAGRLKEAHHVPAIVFAPVDPASTQSHALIKGSARSIDGIHIRDAIEAVANAQPELITHFGGHAMAAGLTLPKCHFDDFKTAFDHVVRQADDDVFTRQRLTDGSLLPHEFSLTFIKQLQAISVWGHGFTVPQFDGVFGVQNARILKDKHLKLMLTHHQVTYPIDAIWFGYDTAAWDYRASEVHVLYELSINDWQGSQSLQLIVKDLKVIKTS